MTAFPQNFYRQAGVGLIVGMPLIGHAVSDYAHLYSGTRHTDLPAGWRLDVGSGTSLESSRIEALFATGVSSTGTSMSELHPSVRGSSTTESLAVEKSARDLIDEYAPHLSPQDIAIFRELAGSMSTPSGDPSRNAIYDSY